MAAVFERWADVPWRSDAAPAVVLSSTTAAAPHRRSDLDDDRQRSAARAWSSPDELGQRVVDVVGETSLPGDVFGGGLREARDEIVARLVEQLLLVLLVVEEATRHDLGLAPPSRRSAS